MTIKDGKKALDKIKKNFPQLVDLYNDLDEEDKELCCYIFFIYGNNIYEVIK